MYRLLFIFMTFSAFAFGQTFPDLQSDTYSNSFSSAYRKEYPQLHYSYNDASQIHDYSGNWDLDGDGKNDSILFIGGTGGAHLYYHLKITVSGSDRSYEFPAFEIDFPYLDKSENICKDKSSYLYIFAVSDFDHDGLKDIYLSFDSQTPIPHNWKHKGITSHQIIIQYKGKKVVVRNFDPCIS